MQTGTVQEQPEPWSPRRTRRLTGGSLFNHSLQPPSKMGNVQSEPSAGGGSRKEQASDRASDSRRTPLVEPEVTPSSPAMRLARGLGVWFPGSSGPPGLLIPPEPQASPSPLTLELPSPVTPPPEEAATAAVSTPPPPPVGSLLPAPSKWRKPTGTAVPRIRGLLEASHRGQGDPPSLRPLPPLPRQLTEKEPVPKAPAPPPTLLEPRKQLPPAPPPCDPQPPSRRITLASSATSPTESQVRHSSEGQAAGGARGGAPPQVGEGEMARSATSESGLSLLCKVTFKSGPHLSPASASVPLAAKPSVGTGGGGGLFASSGAISYAEVLKQGPQPPGATRPMGEVPRAAQETEGGDGDGEGCSGPPSAPAPLARALPPPPYTTFPGSKPKFDWVSPPDGTERHFRFNGAAGGIGAPRRRTTTLSGPWGSPPSRSGQTHPASGPQRTSPALLAPPMFIFPAPTNSDPVHSVPLGPQQIPPLPPPPTTPPPAPPPTPQPPALPKTPILVARLPTPGPGQAESALAPTPPPSRPPTVAADLVPPPLPAPVPATSPAPATPPAEPSPPVPQPTKIRTRKNKGPRAARGVIREEVISGDGPRELTSNPVTDSNRGGGGSSGTSTAGAPNKGAVRHWPPFEVLNSCPCKCYCRHQPRHRRLPRNVSAWLSTPTNHLSEPPWVATVKLAGSLVAGLEHYDLQATHSN